ncbi:unnamed protein product [Gongylonema pulchrum]|uniref:Protein DIS3 homolog n=1 Tax=Gongylonema pulchrum TaxID=637853 RepID=A0A183DPQ2_9BILA|nr:unnamed protein product [Gongylonema pulchrum]
MLELNVKQSGISKRVLNVLYRKTKSGKVVKRVHEQYLRNDIGCGLDSCRCCQPVEGHSLTDLSERISSAVPINHAIILDSSAIIRFHHLFENPVFSNIIITQTVWEDVKKSNPPAYKSMLTLCYESPDRKVYVFMDDFHHETHLDRITGESEEDRLTRSLLTCARYYEEHWKHFTITPVLICGTATGKNRLTEQFKNVFTLQEYVEEADSRGRILFPEHLPHDVIQNGIRSGKYKKAAFQVSRENYLEATVHIDEKTTWFIQGRINMNRAVNGDTLRDVEEIEMKDAVDKDEDKDDENEPEKSKKPRLEDKVPSAKVVGIVKRNWRQYYSTRVLFAAAERLIPRIRIETRQADRIRGKRVVVAIDSWPRDSRYPIGHYVRSIGTVGDRETENEVLLLEHDVPHGPFSEAVYACLPDLPWNVPSESHRKDLRSLTICSVDPPGCTDIDDALHCRQIDSDRFEVGVHIADVSHFVRPDTAMDAEAAHRGTTVYLCDKRIDMLPELLSSDLCSLRENVDRLAFSVIWTLTSNADIIDVKFHKSIIRSSGALTYEQAQKMIDDTSLSDPVTVGLRGLLALSRKLKEKRHVSGALTLASSEIRFNIDSETKDPINVLEKKALPTNSMMAKAKGFKMNVESGKTLSESLDMAIDPKNEMVNTLFRMLTTRCMTQAVYFSSGSLPTEKYFHFGLAAPIYTHFTSPIRRYADIMVHRLLAASIHADSTFPEMLKGDLVTKIANNLNYRHKQAQYAGRASVLLNTLLYFKGRTELHDGFVFVPAYGFESVVVFPVGSNYQVTDDLLVAEGTEVRSFSRIKVKLSLDESDVQHIRLDMKLVSPKIPGFSVDYILSAPED